MIINSKIKALCMGLIIFSVAINLTGCNALINKATKNSEERARKFSNDELCKHLSEDTNPYYAEANKQEVKLRQLKCK